MNYWEKNIENLKNTAPELADALSQAHVPADHRVLPSKKGGPYLQIGQQRLHSTYDPEGEGLAWAQAQALGEKEPVVIFGLGLGYHVLPLLKEGREVWVVEPLPAVARLAMEHQDLTSWWTGGGLRLGRNFTDVPTGLRLLAHSPSRRLHAGLCRRLAVYLAGEENAGGFLRILVVGPLYGGSHPIARSCARGFRGLGHQAELLDFAPFYQGYQTLKGVTKDKAMGLKLTQDLLRFLGDILVARVRDFHPDLVFLLAQAPVEPKLLKALRGEGALLAYWFVEDFQVFPYWRDLAPEVDVFFTIQREPFFSELKKLGLNNFSFLPLASDPEVYRPLSLTLEETRHLGAAVSFVGAGYQNRREFFQGLLDFDVKIWGSDWNLNSPLGPFIQKQGARVSEEEAVKIFNASRINLNLHSSPYHLGIKSRGRLCESPNLRPGGRRGLSTGGSERSVARVLQAGGRSGHFSEPCRSTGQDRPFPGPRRRTPADSPEGPGTLLARSHLHCASGSSPGNDGRCLP
jgi:spore maturation protein CgeB